MNIVIGVIVENTIHSAKQNEELMLRRANKETQRHLETLRRIFEDADEDGSGTMELDEFIAVLQKPETISSFVVLDLPYDDPEGLFMILDEQNTGSLPIDSFVHSVMLLRGAASARDLMGLVVGIRSLVNRTNHIDHYVKELERMMTDMPDAIRRAVQRAVTSR